MSDEFNDLFDGQFPALFDGELPLEPSFFDEAFDFGLSDTISAVPAAVESTNEPIDGSVDDAPAGDSTIQQPISAALAAPETTKGPLVGSVAGIAAGDSFAKQQQSLDSLLANGPPAFELKPKQVEKKIAAIPAALALPKITKGPLIASVQGVPAGDTTTKTTTTGLRFKTLAEAQAAASTRTPVAIPGDDFAMMDANPTPYIKKIMAAFSAPLSALPAEYTNTPTQKAEWLSYQTRANERCLKLIRTDASCLEISAWLIFGEIINVHKNGLMKSAKAPAITTKASEHLDAVLEPIRDYAILRVDLLRQLRIEELVSNAQACVTRKLSNFKGNSRKTDRDAENAKAAAEQGVPYEMVLGNQQQKQKRKRSRSSEEGDDDEEDAVVAVPVKKVKRSKKKSAAAPAVFGGAMGIMGGVPAFAGGEMAAAPRATVPAAPAFSGPPMGMMNGMAAVAGAEMAFPTAPAAPGASMGMMGGMAAAAGGEMGGRMGMGMPTGLEALASFMDGYTPITTAGYGAQSTNAYHDGLVGNGDREIIELD